MFLQNQRLVRWCSDEKCLVRKCDWRTSEFWLSSAADTGRWPQHSACLLLATQLGMQAVQHPVAVVLPYGAWGECFTRPAGPWALQGSGSLSEMGCGHHHLPDSVTPYITGFLAFWHPSAVLGVISAPSKVFLCAHWSRFPSFPSTVSWQYPFPLELHW